jgi:hypothetical protein
LAAEHGALAAEAAPAAQAAAEHSAAEHSDHADRSAADHAEHLGAEGAPAAKAASEQLAAEHLEWGAESALATTADEKRPQDEAPLQNLGTQDLGTQDLGTQDLGTASYQRLGAEGLVRLRARYAEVMARIAERPLEEEAREELKQRAERLNPDAWVTADEVSAALEQYETVFEGLRGIVGRHPRRRRRGRR